MSTLTVTVEKITIHRHPNADALEIAQVGLYRAVVAKGRFSTGDLAVYIPEQAILPAPLVEELGLTGRLAGPLSNRIKAVRLRGELSQGIVCLPHALSDVDLAHAHATRRDFSVELGITKWTPPVPPHLTGNVEAATELLPWIEIENVQRYPDLFAPGEPVVATEKIHGTACLYTRGADGTDHVSSKGYGGKGLGLIRDPDNLYWKAILAYHVPDMAAEVADRLGAARVGVFGEVFGKGVQDLTYGALGRAGTPGYAVFDIAWSDASGRVSWLDAGDLHGLLASLSRPLPAVPLLYAGPYDFERLRSLATGKETVSGTRSHIREGLVIRTASDRRSEATGGRAIGKLVSPEYLMRKNGTEYQ